MIKNLKTIKAVKITGKQGRLWTTNLSLLLLEQVDIELP